MMKHVKDAGPFSQSRALILAFAVLVCASCAPSPQANVVGYLIEQRFGGNLETVAGEHATLTGRVHVKGEPLAGATVLVATRTGAPFTEQTDEDGRFRIEGIPPGTYVPAAVAPNYEEVALAGSFGLPWPVQLLPGEVVEAPPIEMKLHEPPPIPSPLPDAVDLEYLGEERIGAPFPDGAMADERRFRFRRDGVEVDSLRLYLPTDGEDEASAVLYAVYPTDVDGWRPVSVALASQGYRVLAISPVGAHGVDIDAHTLDARTGLALARGGHLGVDLGNLPTFALGGSFSSAVLHRLLRDEGRTFQGWVTLGGITNAFSGSADFYAGRLNIPEQFALVIPALGAANLYPLPFLRYSPVYTAAQLPPTLIIHTHVDDIIPVDQAEQLETALRKSGVPVEVFYYEDVSHYLQIGEDLTETGESMFWLVVDFIDRYVETETKD